MMLATPMAAAQEIQDDPNRPADQLAPDDASLTPGADEVDMVGDVEAQRRDEAARADGLMEPDVSMTKFGTVDLAVQDADLSKILEMLSVQSRKNIIAGRDVVATVSANLYDVTFHEALDSILRVNGYGYIEEGNFIYVHPLDEIDQIQSAAKRVETRIYELYYISATDAESVVTPLLSAVGQTVPMGVVDDSFNPDDSNNGTDSWAYSARLIVSDYPEVLNEIATIIKDLDLPPTQVLVEGTILTTKVDEKNAWGVDWSIISSINFTDVIGGPLQTVNNLIGGDISTTNALGGVSNVGKTAAEGGFKFGVVKDHFSLFLRALDEVADTTVIARPKVMCLNRQKAEILVGRRVAYLSTTETETTTTQTVEYLDTGIHLVFRPYISPDNMIRMELYPRLSDAELRPITDVMGNKVDVPDEITSEIFANVRVRDGETLVLGGLFRESTVIKRDQVPLLGDLPIAGAAFTGQDDKIVREEIIFMLTPTVVRDERLWEAGKDGLEILDSIRVGTRSGLLPFSKTRMTSNYNRDALEAYRNGELDLALFYANSSLRLDSTQPEMHRLRSTFASEATGEAWERSLHERILQREMEFVPADTLNPEPTPDFKIDEAPSSRVPEVQETTSNTKGPSQSIDPIDPDELALSLSRSLAGAGFGASSDPDPSASSNEIVSASGADQE
jgi:type IV pilus assembly protein PilQ